MHKALSSRYGVGLLSLRYTSIRLRLTGSWCTQRLREWIIKPHEKLLKAHPELIPEMPFQ